MDIDLTTLLGKMPQVTINWRFPVTLVIAAADETLYETVDAIASAFESRPVFTVSKPKPGTLFIECPPTTNDIKCSAETGDLIADFLQNTHGLRVSRFIQSYRCPSTDRRDYRQVESLVSGKRVC